jgi:cysteine-rich repeat protein
MGDIMLYSRYTLLLCLLITVGCRGFCGDGIFDPNNKFEEECDDHNDINNDGCTNLCKGNQEPTANNDTLTTEEDISAFSISIDELLANDTDPNDDVLTITAISAVQSGTITLNSVAQTIEFRPPQNFNGIVTFTYTASDGVFNAAATVTIEVSPENDPPVVDALTIATLEDTPVNMTFTASDIEGDAFTFLIDSQPANGAVAAVGATFVYTPNANFFGADTFTIRAKDTDPSLSAAIVTVNVSPVNDNPIATNATTQVNEDSSAAITLAATDIEDSAANLTFIVIGFPSHGTISGTAPNLIYSTDPDFAGNDSLAFLVFDSDGGVDEGTVNIQTNPVQDAPVVNDQTFILEENTTRTFIINGFDQDGDGLDFSVLTTLQPFEGTLSAVSDSNPNDQAASLTYTAPDLSPGTGQLLVSIIFQVSDGFATDTAQINIVVREQDQPPVTANDTKTINEDAGLSFPSSSLLINDTDADGDELFIVGFQNAINCIPSIAGNGIITVSFAPNFNGTAAFEYVVSDTFFTDVGLVTITVIPVNDAPVATDDAFTIAEDTPTFFSTLLANDTDVENNALNITSVQNFQNGTATFIGNIVNFTPNANFFGAASFDYTISDGQGGSDTAQVAILVEE